MSLEKMRIAVDVANGAGYKSTPCILRELGAELTVAHNQPNGTNINAQCGSIYPEEIQRLVRESGAMVGISNDGDADRVLLCDEQGEIVDGDEILAIASVDLLRSGQLQQNTLVATVMSNFGLDEALAAHGGKVFRTKVGDRYVIEEMVRQNLNLGGEQSGHMIFRDFTTTGDGIISALQILRIMQATGKPLSELKKCLTKYPQAQRNLLVKEKPPLETLPEVMKLVQEAEKELHGKGRVLLRYSGTEAKIRLLDRRPRAQSDRPASRSNRGSDSEGAWRIAPAGRIGRMGHMNLSQVIEALLFSAQKPLTPRELVVALRGAGAEDELTPNEFAKTTEAAVAAALEQLKIEYLEQQRAFQLLEKAEGWQLASDPQYARWVRQLFPAAKPARLTPPALETLAIIAYRQPITRADVEAVRGVAIESVLQTLMERGLVKIAGRAEVPGRPLLYETTQFFLEHFGLRNLDELPNSEELKRRELPKAPTGSCRKRYRRRRLCRRTSKQLAPSRASAGSETRSATMDAVLPFARDILD